MKAKIKVLVPLLLILGGCYEAHTGDNGILDLPQLEDCEWYVTKNCLFSEKYDRDIPECVEPADPQNLETWCEYSKCQELDRTKINKYVIVEECFNDACPGRWEDRAAYEKCAKTEPALRGEEYLQCKMDTPCDEWESCKEPATAAYVVELNRDIAECAMDLADELRE